MSDSHDSFTGARLDVGSSPATALTTAISAMLGIALAFASPTRARGGDILRGGAPAGVKPPGSSQGVAVNQPAALKAGAAARDALARSTRALQSVKAMQQSARQLSARGLTAPRLNPQTGKPLPPVANGLRPGGLQVATGVPIDLKNPAVGENPKLWQGALLPKETSKGGRTLVTVEQTQQQALLTWKSFNIGKETTLRFDQSRGGNNKGQWIAFNKVNDPTGVPSQILGSIEAPGQVYVINQNGIIFGGSSQINLRTLVASTLPINDNLVGRGLLNNPDTQFLFSALTLPAGSKGTPAFVPEASLRADGRQGDVIVEAGARISSPVGADGNGGRVMLVGANVHNAGTISTPNGQTILAAGLQVGVDPHKSSDPSLRGLDVYVGKVKKPAPVADPQNPDAPLPPAEPAYAGTVTNSGLIEVPRGNLSMAGKSVNQLGAVTSSTSVSLNGRIDLNANYNAVPNPAYDAAIPANGAPFLFQSTGSVKLGLGSVTQILPELTSSEKAVGLELALRSQINIQGRSIYLAPDAMVLAPSANVKLQAGSWGFAGTAQRPVSTFISAGGQVFLDDGAFINVAGVTDITAPLSHSILSLELRGSELAPSPLQRNSMLRGPTLTLDLRNRGYFNGREWIGTPLGDVSGYLGLIERTVGELTAEGGTVDISAGGSVVLQKGSVVDVSGGWIRYEGGMVQTTRVLSGGQLIDIAHATPDRVYDGIYTGTSTFTSAKWGITETFTLPLAPRGEYFEPSAIHGMDAGAITITAPSMALDGELIGRTVAGPRQLRESALSSSMPRTASLSLSFQAQDPTPPNYIPYFPTPPQIIFQDGVTQSPVQGFALNANGDPLDLDAERKAKVYLSPGLLTENGFGHLTIENSDGSVLLPAGVTLETAPGGSISITAANIDIRGSVTSPGGSLSFTALNLSPYEAALIAASPTPQLPAPNPTRGIFTLASGASLSTAGLISDGRYPDLLPLAPHGGTINIAAFSADLAKGSVIDVSGGAIVTATGERHYGHAGSISIKTGQDPKLLSLLGGQLTLNSTLLGYSGAIGGSLTLQAPLVQIGGTSTRPETLLLQPEFFSTGGFGSFTVTGLGVAPDSSDSSVPELYVAPGTVIEPVSKSLNVIPHPEGVERLSFGIIEKVAGQRTPVSIHLNAPGGTDSFSGGLMVRGDLVMAQDSVIRTDPLANVSFNGSTVAVLGSVFAPGGTISISGGKNSASIFGGAPTESLTTTYLGPQSVLSTAGTTVYVPDPFGRRIGAVLPGGVISVTGNIVAATGALLDVSGTSGILDLHPAAVRPLTEYGIPANSGTTASLAHIQTVPTTVDSSAGTIMLHGAQMLHSDATLLGRAGGATALGGTLEIASGRFYLQDVPAKPFDTNLVVSQAGIALSTSLPANASLIGKPVIAADGTTLIDRGFFGADAFASGGFDSLSLDGVVDFKGAVTIAGRGALRIADGGVLFADSTVRLSAPYVALGTAFPTPVRPEDRTSPFQDGNQPWYFPPTFGSGRLIVDAGLIDVGTLSLQNIGNATLTAVGGDIRGSGTLNIAGHLTLKAGQIYPVTASDFTIVAYDYKVGESTKAGSVSILGAGTAQMPLSAGGTLSIYASNINQSGVLRAPLGTINLGWDGTGAAPTDLLTGTTLAFPVTNNLTMGAGSITSVSAVDPVTGKGIMIPYGISPDGNSWIDPRGVDITAGGLPEKRINLSGTNVVTERGSVVDLRGGGELYAYRWVEGNGGPEDILAASGSFAVIPGYGSNFVPFAPFNVSTTSTNLIAGYGPGYTNDTLKVGDRIYLSASNSLAAGYYTLLPARYALMPGAVLVTPKSGLPVGTVETPEGASFVSGYRFNALNGSRSVPTGASWFEVAATPVVRARAEYHDYFANAFLAESAKNLNLDVPRLPTDSGHLVFQASNAMNLQGSVLSPSVSGGRGSSVDISTPRDIVISGSHSSAGAGVVSLNANVLNSFGAESLLIGGKRVRGENGITIVVQSGNITVDNAGAPLSAPDLILAAKTKLTLAEGAKISASGSTSSPSDTLFLTGDGALVRVSTDPGAAIVRTDVTSAAEPTLTIGAGARVSGASLILDSTSATDLDPSAVLKSNAYTLNSGRISLQLDEPGPLLPGVGLVLTGVPLQNLLKADSLSLLSYSSIDIYGTGQIGTRDLRRLALSAGEIRGFNQGNGTARFVAENILLRNTADVTSPGPVAASSGTLEFEAGTIQLGVNQVAIDQYSNVVLNASEQIVGQGKGGISVQGDLSAITPVITGRAGATRTITAGGTITMTAPAEGSAVRAAGALGASLSLTGASVDIGTQILLPSGLLSIRATSGDLTIGGRLDVSGSREEFYDVVRYTDAGEIRLSADAGHILLGTDSIISVAANAGGGSAGSLIVSTPNGAFTSSGTLLGKGGVGGRNGTFALDTATLTSTATLSEALTASSLTESQTIRVRNGDVLIDGVAKARTFRLSADQGAITVTGTIDASGRTGGTISLISTGDLTLESGALLTAAGEKFSNAGKGGAIHLEAGAQRNGVVGTGSVDIRTGSTIDLSVAAKVDGNAVTLGSSAYQGQFSGTLHIRAPQNSTFTDLLVNPINGTIVDASSILVEGYRLYDLTASNGAITTTVQTNIRNNATSFLGAAGSTTSGYTAMMNRLLANNAGLESVTVLAPGAELINRTGNLTLGTTSSTDTSDWNLATFRFGAKSAPGVLTLRAAGNLVFYNALSDGFATSAYTARLLTQNTLLPVNTQSWSYRLTAGADLNAADFRAVLPTVSLGTGAGFLQLGKNNGNNLSNSNGTNNAPGNNATTSQAIANRFQVIRTGSGDIEINTGRSVQLLNHFATIYTAGTRVTNATLDGAFDLPVLNQSGGEIILGANQQPTSYPALYTMAGGNVTIHAQENIEHLTRNNAGQLVADSQRQLPNNWLYRRGYIDPLTGEFGVGRFNDVTTTSWWIDFSNFFQGVGALGGGDVTMIAGNNISNVDAVIPTNARMSKGTPSASSLLELGGGDLVVRAGNNIDAGVYYVERGHGTLSAGNEITTNATRSPSLTNLTAANTVLDSHTWLPTTLFLGKGGFDVSARGDVLLGPVGNPFLLPQGINNTFWYKTYFSTYAPDSYVNVSSMGGDVTLRQGIAMGNIVTPLLQAWVERQHLLSFNSASFYQPWLRLAESSVLPFNTVVSLMPPTVQATAYSGDINLAGNLTLSPAASGTLDLLAGRTINGLNRNGSVTLLSGEQVTSWGTSRVNISDADPSAIPGIASPYGYQAIAGLSTGEASRTEANFLEFVDKLFRESGGTIGEQGVLQTKLSLHAPGPLHIADPNPTRLYAGTGDISGLTLFSPKAAQIYAGQDILDVAFYLQNVNADDTSIVASGRDIVPYSANSPLRVAANAPGNIPLNSDPLAGDIQVSGPGTLQVLAGRTLDLGTGPNNADGTGVGITSIGNARNPYLGFEGANLIVGAGIGASTGLAGSSLDFDKFISDVIEGPDGQRYLDELKDTLGDRSFKDLTGEERNRIALQVFFLVLRDSGRNNPADGGYEAGFAAIGSLFGDSSQDGEILTRGRDIRTRSGGDITILAPGGGLTLANTAIGNPLSPPGIITESGGRVSIFTDGNVDIGIGRIFTLRGGDLTIWSSSGDIAAGSAPKTVQSAPPTRVVIDPQSASVQTDLAGLATGGGIGVLATVEGLTPGNVDLIAPAGTVDAGDAGIRVSGNLTIAAVEVLNADNIQVAGTNAGAGAPAVVAAPSMSVGTGSVSAVAATNSATENATQAARSQASAPEELPSIISVEVIGYGGGDEDDDEKKKESGTTDPGRAAAVQNPAGPIPRG